MDEAIVKTQPYHTNTAPTDAEGYEPAIADPPAHLYDHDEVFQGGVTGLAALSAAELTLFREQGFLMLRQALSAAEVQDSLAGIEALCAGQVSGDYVVRYEADARGRFDPIKPERRQDAIRKLSDFVAFEPRLQAVSRHAGIQRVLREVLGEEPRMFQDMALLKPPRIGREKPWHQDCAYFDLPEGTPVAGIWLALDEALVENGCMHVIPGTHVEGPVVHFQRRDWQICDTEVQTGRCLALPMQPGDCLFFDGLLHHGTPPSHSPQRRRALQFHYRPASADFLPDDRERLRLFGEGGKDVSC
ncbi:MAG: phytanoyl-CoA dioxygenase family protein [Anaerolineaceae bacterium]|nr:phytanoyl-CoA dioxygenase family protein [Anaerolineaceae bacterium]MDE0329465.1 phytanoyl-CoA dioxygenase family protein [Anaerolineaceae bacterium]